MRFARLFAAICFLVAAVMMQQRARADYLYVQVVGFNNPIYQVTPIGDVEELTTIQSYVLDPLGPWLASDGVGHLYVSSGTPMYKLGDGGVSIVPIGGIPEQIAADRQGNLFVVDQGNALYKVEPNGNTSLAFPGGSFNGIVADANGNLYAAEGGVGIERRAPDGTVSQYGPSFMPAIQQPAVDAAGNLYVLSLIFAGGATSESLLEITPQQDVVTLADHLQLPRAVAVDSSGTVYVSEAYQDQTGRYDYVVDRITGGTAVPFLGFSGEITGLVASPMEIVVPEPAVAGLLSCGGFTLLCRRRKVQTGG